MSKQRYLAQKLRANYNLDKTNGTPCITTRPDQAISEYITHMMKSLKVLLRYAVRNDLDKTTNAFCNIGPVRLGVKFFYNSAS